MKRDEQDNRDEQATAETFNCTVQLVRQLGRDALTRAFTWPTVAGLHGRYRRGDVDAGPWSLLNGQPRAKAEGWTLTRICNEHNEDVTW